ncbi:MAG: cobalt-precorrin-6A reductase [Alphaproteobacteria bacterium]|nr:cobalt-precorrin-6A reductase [Alphaproteobacteria bacterium]
MILILGGTSEAYDLAEALAGRGVSVTTSLAGRTTAPRLPAGLCRVGGFGGAEGLCRWMGENGVRVLVDATHPFSLRISENARRASLSSGVPCLRLERPPWRAGAGDDWRMFGDEAEVAAALPESARVFLGLGRQRLGVFAGSGCYFVVRFAEPFGGVLPFAGECVVDRGPFEVEGERELFVSRGVTHVVVRNSGGSAWQKLAAARMLGLPVFMVERPAADAGADQCDSVESAMDWIGGRS